VNRVTPLQPVTAHARHILGLERKGHARCGCELCQDIAQAAGGDGVFLRACILLDYGGNACGRRQCECAGQAGKRAAYGKREPS
jgi:hypothetical protein